MKKPDLVGVESFDNLTQMQINVRNRLAEERAKAVVIRRTVG